MTEAVIFDIDGTLVDSNHQHAETWQRAFEHFGIQVDFESVRRQIGKGGDQLIPVFLPAGFGTEEMRQKLGRQIEEYRARLFQREYLPHLQPIPGGRELIQRILADGRKVGLASSARGEELGTYKHIARINDLIEEETSSRDAERSKPHPDIFEAALEKLRVHADHAIVIGDTPYDAQAAARIHLRTIGVESGGWSAEDLREAGCIETYRDVADLLQKYATSSLAEIKAA